MYPLTTVLCHSGKNGDREGRVLAATQLTIFDKDGTWLRVHTQGWRQDGVTALIYALQGKRIFTDHFLVNHWIGCLKDMKRYINLEREEYLFLQKSLQLHGQDVPDPRRLSANKKL